MGLAGSGDVGLLAASRRDPSPSVRLGAVVALRRLGRAEVAEYLDDSAERVVTEAARAIYDAPITAALPALAGKIGRLDQVREPFWRRVVNANFRLGTPEAAHGLAELAAQEDRPAPMRAEALAALAQWAHPPKLDRMTNLAQALPDRDPAMALEAAQPFLAKLVVSKAEGVAMAAIQLADQLSAADLPQLLASVVRDENQPGKSRAAALNILGRRNAPQLPELVSSLAQTKDESLRREVIQWVAKGESAAAVVLLEERLAHGSMRERQAAYRALGSVASPEADRLLLHALDDLAAGQLPPELELETVTAARLRSSPEIQEKLRVHDASLDPANPSAPFHACLAGGDAASGRKIFFERTDASCIRCHKIEWVGGDVGPALTKIGEQKDRAYILESIVAPNKQIAAGFESAVLTMRDGSIYAGIVKQENDVELALTTAGSGDVRLDKDSIATRERGPSAMPEGFGQILNQSDLRDLVDFLAGQK